MPINPVHFAHHICDEFFEEIEVVFRVLIFRSCVYSLLVMLYCIVPFLDFRLLLFLRGAAMKQGVGEIIFGLGSQLGIRRVEGLAE